MGAAGYPPERSISVACYTTPGPIGHGCEIESHATGQDRGAATAGARDARGSRAAAAASPRAWAPDAGGGGPRAAARLLADDGLRVPARRLRALPDERVPLRSRQHPGRIRHRPRSAAQGGRHRHQQLLPPGLPGALDPLPSARRRGAVRLARRRSGAGGADRRAGVRFLPAPRLLAARGAARLPGLLAPPVPRQLGRLGVRPTGAARRLLRLLRSPRAPLAPARRRRRRAAGPGRGRLRAGAAFEGGRDRIPAVCRRLGPRHREEPPRGVAPAVADHRPPGRRDAALSRRSRRDLPRPGVAVPGRSQLPRRAAVGAGGARHLPATARLAGRVLHLSPRASRLRAIRGAGAALRRRAAGPPAGGRLARQAPPRARPAVGLGHRLAAAGAQPLGARPAMDGDGPLPVPAVARPALASGVAGVAAVPGIPASPGRPQARTADDRVALAAGDHLRHPRRPLFRDLP